MKTVYSFDRGVAEGDASMRDTLGGKGANLAEMTNLGIPVPPGFTLSCKLCLRYLEERALPESVRAEANAAMRRLEEATGKVFGDADNPLLVSVRSGAPVSMPGMMDTILDLGLSDASVEGLARQTGNPRFAYDSYRRFVQMYGEVVGGVSAHLFEQTLAGVVKARGVDGENGLPAEDLRRLVASFKQIFARETGTPFPEDPWAQIRGAVEAVFESWNVKRAVDYRRVHGLSHDMGTAVNIQAMVYGNMGEDSGTGVVFTRDPATGARQVYGEFLVDAQGEDIVAGTRTPQPIQQMRELMPGLYAELCRNLELLERHYREMQDVELTVERGTLYILQTRTGKRAARAAVRIATDMAREGLIDRREALRRVSPDSLDQLLHPMIDPEAEVDVLTVGLPASPGAAGGRVVFDADEAEARAAAGDPVILVREETSPDDFHGLVAARGILTSRGGMTSHAAVVARGMGKCCVAGAREVRVDGFAGVLSVDGRVVHRDEWLTLDGSTGRVIVGEVPLVAPEPGPEFELLLGWADEVATLEVRANADTPDDALLARELGAAGIGLCRTEHMFFGGDRIEVMREMILAEGVAERQRALDQLLPMQRSDFAGLFRAMDGYPVTIRLLDPPLHEFLPREPDERRELARRLGISDAELDRKIASLTEANPMLGHRGCRLGISYPEITEMQARAIFEAACDAACEGVSVRPEIMVPLVGHVEELRRQAALVRATAGRVFVERGQTVGYMIGNMIEVPRAVLVADALAAIAEFFSFGTNDLTQMTLGLSRDDAGRFLPWYVEAGILPDDPFRTLDLDGVGRLVELGVARGREANPGLEVGVCGEHGGDPVSIGFFHRAGADYVSCSPYRVPIARLAAAQAAMADEGRQMTA